MNHNDFYDVLYENSPDIKFYVEMAEKFGHGNVLEVGSGSGRILLEIAKKGINIDGLEPNKERFDCCKSKIDKLNDVVKNNVNIFQSFSSDYKTNKKYSLIIMPFRVIQEATSVNDQEETLKYIKTLLNPDGVLIFDVLYPSPKLLCEFENNKNVELSQKHIQDKGMDFYTSFVVKEIDTMKQTFSAERVYKCNDKEVSYSWHSRYLTRYEAEYLLKYLNFKIADVWGDFEMTPLDSISHPKNMIFVAKN